MRDLPALGCHALFANETRRLAVVTRTVALALLACMACSWKLWQTRPLYPLVPVAGLVPALPSPWDGLVLIGWCGLIAALAWRPDSNRLVGLVLVVMAMLFLQDQSRLWPSFYQFFLLLLLRSGYRPTAADAAAEAARVLAGMRFLVAAIYVWAGIHKLTPQFFTDQFPWFVEPLTGWLPFEPPWLSQIGLLAALAESLLGLGLLSDRFRRASLVGLLLMHGLIFFCIGPLRGQWNNAAWLWSQAAAVITLLLFFRAPAFRFGTMLAGPLRAAIRPAVVLVLAGILPALNGFNRWDSALSFNVYSGNVSQAEICLMPEGVAALPSALAPFLEPGDPCTVLHLDAWARAEFQANQYPENRIFRAVFHRICELVPPGKAILFVREKAGWFTPGRVRREDCPAPSHP
jgi:hypothetical protein